MRVKNPINMDYRISKYDPLESIQEVIHKQLFQARVSSENIAQRLNIPRAPANGNRRTEHYVPEERSCESCSYENVES